MNTSIQRAANTWLLPITLIILSPKLLSDWWRKKNDRTSGYIFGLDD
jgi:hypothetical protein